VNKWKVGNISDFPVAFLLVQSPPTSMPESPVRMKNGPTASGSVTSIQKEFQQKFLQGDGSPFASGDNEREQLERLLKQNNPNLAKKYIRASDWAPNHAVRGQLWIRLCKRLTSEAEWTHSVQHYKETLPDVYKKVDCKTQKMQIEKTIIS
jgi:hypothetical protein